MHVCDVPVPNPTAHPLEHVPVVSRSTRGCHDTAMGGAQLSPACWLPAPELEKEGLVICQSGLKKHQSSSKQEETCWRLHWRPKKQHAEMPGWQEVGCFIGLYLLCCR